MICEWISAGQEESSAAVRITFSILVHLSSILCLSSILVHLSSILYLSSILVYLSFVLYLSCILYLSSR